MEWFIQVNESNLLPKSVMGTRYVDILTISRRSIQLLRRPRVYVLDAQAGSVQSFAMSN